MKTWFWIGAAALALAFAASCGNKKDDAKPEAKADDTKGTVADPPKTPAAAVSTLWDLAPADAVAGIVLQPGSIEKAYATLDEVRRVAGADPTLGPLVKKALTLSDGPPFDPFSLDAVRTDGGVDPLLGAAMFFDADGEVALVATPFADVAGLEKFLAKPYTPDGDLRCGQVAKRLVCAPTQERVDAAGKGGAALIDGVPSSSRGDIELVVDFAKIPPAQAGLAKLIRNAGKLSVGARLDDGVLALHAHMAGQLVLPGATSSKPSLPIDEIARDAVGLVRLHWDAAAAMKLAPLPPSLPLTPDFDARKHFLDQLTGEAVIATTTGRIGGGFRAVIGLRDPAHLSKSLGELCALAETQLPQLKMQFQSGMCHAQFDVPPVPDLPPGLVPTGKMAAYVEVREGGVWLHVGDDGGPGRVPPVSKHVAPMQTASAMLAGWGRSFDPFAALPADARKALDVLLAKETTPQQRAGLRAARWIASHIAEIGVSVALEEGGVGLSIVVVTFAADPPATYHAYEALVTKDLDGNHAGYRKGLDFIAAQDGTQSASQASIVKRGGPALGFGSGVLAAIAIPAFVKYKQKSEMAGAFDEIKRIYDSVESPK